MDSERLYKVKKQDLPKIEELLMKCFSTDPLYEKLIPNTTVRNRLLPELFKCDLNEFYETCEIFADSNKLNGILVVSDESEPYNLIKYLFSQVQATLKTDGYLIKEDNSLKTFFNFMIGKDYLNSTWTEKLHQEQRIHIIYLAVDPEKQHNGIAATLVEEVIHYADKYGLMVSLETHNVENVAFYKQFNFRIHCVVEKHFHLKQYCLVRDAQ